MENVEKENTITSNVAEEEVEQARPVEKINEAVDITPVGIPSSDVADKDPIVFNQNDEREDYEEKMVAQFEKYKLEKKILSGKVIGVEPDETTHRPWAIVLYEGMTVKIPDVAFFEDTFGFGDDYESKSDKEKRLIREKWMKRYMRAEIPFVVVAVAEAQVEREDIFNSTVARFAVGDRKTAMKMIRDFYFYGKDVPGMEGVEHKEIKVGSTTLARILIVDVNRVVAEVCGVETRIDAYGVTNQSIDNCRDIFEPGDVMKVTIRKFYDDGPDGLHVGVSARLRNVSKNINLVSEGSWYSGKVDSYNPDKHTYSVVLDNGVNATVKDTNVYGGRQLVDNDCVSVLVTKKLPTFVVGFAIKI